MENAMHGGDTTRTMGQTMLSIFLMSFWPPLFLVVEDCSRGGITDTFIDGFWYLDQVLLHDIDAVYYSMAWWCS